MELQLAKEREEGEGEDDDASIVREFLLSVTAAMKDNGEGLIYGYRQTSRNASNWEGGIARWEEY